MANPLLDATSLPRFTDISPTHVLPTLKELVAALRQKLHELLDNTPEPDFDSIVALLRQCSIEGS